MTNLFAPGERTVAYFSMEIGLAESIPTYSGGLGLLAGDTIRSAADNRVPMVAVSLAHRKGYFYQRLDPGLGQIEEPVAWALEDQLTEEAPRVEIQIDGRKVAVRAWRYDVVGLGGFVVPVYLLDTHLGENTEWDRSITDVLYGGDQFYRLAQEAVLGIAGLRMLRALGFQRIERFHMNEGHAGLLTFEALMELARAAGREAISRADIESIRTKCVFTTHTPVAAGHDQFPLGLVKKVLERSDNLLELKDVFCLQFLSRILGDQPINPDDTYHGFRNEYVLNMTYLALNLSHFVNGVAKKHGEVSRHMFADHRIDAITNGVHVATWASPPFQELFDKYIEGWRGDNFNLRYMINVPKEDVWRAHRQAKDRLLSYINRETNAGLEREAFTLGFARRFATYKRPDLLLSDGERLKRICRDVGPIQIIYSGKAHPADGAGKEMLKTVLRAKEELRGHVRIAFVPNYGMETSKLLTSGCDVWLNTPKRPMEASGTSGMKAAVNGVPSLSVLDGWWIEGCIEGITGWAIGGSGSTSTEAVSDAEEAISLYDKLERQVLPMYYQRREDFMSVMRNAIAFNGSFFNTQRMILQYVLKAYFC